MARDHSLQRRRCRRRCCQIDPPERKASPSLATEALIIQGSLAPEEVQEVDEAHMPEPEEVQEEAEVYL